MRGIQGLVLAAALAAVGFVCNWLYLQPIFDSPDINKQLPTEGKRFATVDKNWRNTLSSAMAFSPARPYTNCTRPWLRSPEIN